MCVCVCVCVWCANRVGKRRRRIIWKQIYHGLSYSSRQCLSPYTIHLHNVCHIISSTLTMSVTFFPSSCQALIIILSLTLSGLVIVSLTLLGFVVLSLPSHRIPNFIRVCCLIPHHIRDVVASIISSWLVVLSVHLLEVCRLIPLYSCQGLSSYPSIFMSGLSSFTVSGFVVLPLYIHVRV